MLVLDAGAFLAIERGDRDVIALIKRERLADRAPLTQGGVLARILPGVQVRALDEHLGRRAGLLLARTKTRDVIDAALALLAHDGDELLTSDTADMKRLLSASGAHVEIVDV